MPRVFSNRCASFLHMWWKRIASVIPFSHTNASYHKVVWFPSQNVYNLLRKPFSLVFSMQRTTSPEASTYSKSLCVWLFLRIRGIRNLNGNISAGAWLIALGLGRWKSAFKHLSGYTASTQHCCKCIITEVLYMSKIHYSQIGIALQNC